MRRSIHVYDTRIKGEACSSVSRTFPGNNFIMCISKSHVYKESELSKIARMNHYVYLLYTTRLLCVVYASMYTHLMSQKLY